MSKSIPSSMIATEGALSGDKRWRRKSGDRLHRQRRHSLHLHRRRSHRGHLRRRQTRHGRLRRRGPGNEVRIHDPLGARSVLFREIEDEVGETHFANVDESAHQVLVAERVDGVLRLIPCRVFHDAVEMISAMPGNG
jgi:hypothetical protein